MVVFVGLGGRNGSWGPVGGVGPWLRSMGDSLSLFCGVGWSSLGGRGGLVN